MAVKGPGKHSPLTTSLLRGIGFRMFLLDLCVSQLLFPLTNIPDKNCSEEELFILALGFRRFRPCSASSKAGTSWLKGVEEESCSAQGTWEVGRPLRGTLPVTSFLQRGLTSQQSIQLSVDQSS